MKVNIVHIISLVINWSETRNNISVVLLLGVTWFFFLSLVFAPLKKVLIWERKIGSLLENQLFTEPGTCEIRQKTLRRAWVRLYKDSYFASPYQMPSLEPFVHDNVISGLNLLTHKSNWDLISPYNISLLNQTLRSLEERKWLQTFRSQWLSNKLLLATQ